MSRFCKTSKTDRLRQRLFFQYNKKDYCGAARLGEALLRAHVNHNSVDTPAYEDDLYNVALVSAAADRADRAIELYTESIHLTFLRVGAGLPVAERLTNLAALLSIYDQHESACRIFMQVLTIRRRLLPFGHIAIGDSLYNIGNALIRANRCREAIPALDSALHIYTKMDSDNLINCLHVIAAAYEELKEYEEALPYAEAAWRGHSIANEPEHYRAGYYLARLYEATGQDKRACNLYLSIMDWVEETVGYSHSGYINLATKAASGLAKLGEYRQSKDILLRLSKIIKGSVGYNNLTYSNCIKNLAAVHRHLGECDEAEALLKSLHESSAPGL